MMLQRDKYIIGVTNWHFSRSFRLIFLHAYNPYLSEHRFINLTTLVPIHFACSLHSQITRKCVYRTHDVANTTFYTTTGDPFQSNAKHELYSMRVKPQARPLKTTPPPGSENPPCRSSRSWLRRLPPIAAAQKIYFFLLLNIPKEYIYMLATPLYICWFVHFQVYNCVIVAHSYSPLSRNHGSRRPIVSGLWLEWAHCFRSWMRTDPLFRTGGWMGPTWILRKPKEDMLMAYISNWQGGF